MIQLKQINKQYASHQVLRDVSLTFEKGKLYVIKGASGCGKSTLLHILSCFDFAYEGEYLFHGTKVTKKNRKQIRKRIASMFQQSLLISSLTVKENLLFLSHDEEKIKQYAKEFEVEHLLQQYPSKLSGGERQKISIIRTLLFDGECIIADEPTASLDLKKSKEIAQLFATMKNENKIIIVATHEDVFDAFADEILEMKEGSIQQNHHNNEQIEENIIKHKPKKKHSFLKMDYCYAKNRRKKRKNKTSILIVAVMTLLFVVSSYFFNAQKAYTEQIFETYPYQLSKYRDSSLNGVEHKEDYHEIPLYQKQVQEFELRNYFANPYCPLHIPNALQEGSYPTKENEVVLSSAAAKLLFPSLSSQETIHQTFELEGKSFEVSAVLTDDFTQLSKVYTGFLNCNFHQPNKQPVIFLSEEMMKQIDATQYNEQILMYNETLSQKEIETMLKNETYPSPYRYDIQSNLSSIQTFQQFILLGCGALFFLIYLYLSSVILMELYERKREFGFLQIFQVSKLRMIRIVYIETMLNMVSLILCSGVISYAVISFLQWYYHLNIQMSLLQYAGITFIICMYVFLLTTIPLYKILRKNILTLIQA